MSISQHQYLVCDKSGQPHHWCSAEDGVVLKYKGLLSYELGDASVFNGGTSRMTGEQSTVEVAPIIFLKETLKYDQRTPPLTNENLFKRDLNICGYCGRHYNVSKLSRDHIHPTSKGGKNIWQNVVTSCKGCNHAKDDMTLSEAGMSLIFIPYVPNHAARLIMQNRRIIADQMEYLQAFLPEQCRLRIDYISKITSISKPQR